MNKVEKKFENKAVKRGEVLLFKKSTAVEYIKECQKLNIKILGIDGFILSPDKTQPSMNNSIDYSQIEENINIYLTAIEFLNSQSDNLYFEIVCDD